MPSQWSAWSPFVIFVLIFKFYSSLSCKVLQESRPYIDGIMLGPCWGPRPDLDSKAAWQAVPQRKSFFKTVCSWALSAYVLILMSLNLLVSMSSRFWGACGLLLTLTPEFHVGSISPYSFTFWYQHPPVHDTPGKQRWHPPSLFLSTSHSCTKMVHRHPWEISQR